MRINTLLVNKLKLTHREINDMLDEGAVCINEVKAQKGQWITAADTISCRGKILQEGQALFYLAYHKPVGVESTMNKRITNNLIEATGINQYFFPVGRLDKASEGLMLLTNDGNLYQYITAEHNKVLKKYLVEVNQIIDEKFLTDMSQGIEILGRYTNACSVHQVSTHRFEISLLEGRNRQIRRMCYKLGYEVKTLCRIAIGKLQLNQLPSGCYSEVTKDMII